MLRSNSRAIATARSSWPVASDGLTPIAAIVRSRPSVRRATTAKSAESTPPEKPTKSDGMVASRDSSGDGWGMRQLYMRTREDRQAEAGSCLATEPPDAQVCLRRGRSGPAI